GALLGANGAKADVAAHLAAREVNVFGDFVDPALCDAHGVAERGHAHYPPAAGHDLAVSQCSAGVENMEIVAIFWQSRDLVADARLARIALDRHDAAQRDTAIPLGVDSVQRALDRVFDERE